MQIWLISTQPICEPRVPSRPLVIGRNGGATWTWLLSVAGAGGGLPLGPAVRYSGRAVTATHDRCRRRARVADAGSMPPSPR
jgi:hypothetical protein